MGGKKVRSVLYIGHAHGEPEVSREIFETTACECPLCSVRMEVNVCDRHEDTQSAHAHIFLAPREKKNLSERCQSMLAMHGANWQRGLTVRLRGANLLRKGWVWWHNVGTSLEANNVIYVGVKPQLPGTSLFF